MTACPRCEGQGADGGCPVCGAGAPAAASSPVQPAPSAADPSPVEPPPLPPADPAPPAPEGPEAPAAEAAADPEPHADLSVRARYEFASVPSDEPPLMGVMVEIEAHGRPLREGTDGPVAHVILALDLSASMNNRDKYPVLRDAVERMLADLRSQSAADVLVSIVAFSRGASVLLRAARARRIRPERLFDAIERHRLCFGNYTDIAGALSKAGRIAYDTCRAHRTLPVRVYLLTDGRPQDVPGARKAAQRLAKVGCDVHALAFGADADVSVLQELFAGGRGGTVKSVRKETIASAFERVAEVSQRVIATRCQVSVDLAPGVTGGDAFRYRPARVRFPDPAFVAGKRFATDLGTIETGRTYSLLLELRPPESDFSPTPLGKVTVRIPGFGGPITADLRLALRRTAPDTEPGAVDATVRTARDILDALTDEDPEVALRSLRLRRKLYAAEKRDPGLLRLLDRSIAMLQKTGSLDGLTRGEFATLRAHTCTSSAEIAIGVAGR